MTNDPANSDQPVLTELQEKIVRRFIKLVGEPGIQLLIAEGMDKSSDRFVQAPPNTRATSLERVRHACYGLGNSRTLDDLISRAPSIEWLAQACDHVNDESHIPRAIVPNMFIIDQLADEFYKRLSA